MIMKKTFLLVLLNFCVFLSVNLFAQPNVSFTASSYDACAPDNIAFTNTSTGCVGTLIFIWNSGNGDISNNEYPVFNYSTGGIYTVSLTVACDNGSDTYEMDITIYDSPEALFDITPINGCVPFTHSFTDLSIEGDGIIDQWTWYFGDGTGSDQQDPTANYDNSGSYNVSLIITDNNDCTSEFTSSSLVSVANNPVVNFSANNTASCTVPHSVTFDANVSTFMGNGYSLVWDFGDGSPTESGDPVSHNYTASGDYDVTLTAIDDFGCEGTITYTDYVQIGSLTAEYSVLEGDVVCLNAETHFQNQTGYSCLWDFGDGSPTSSLSTPTHIYTSAGNMSVTFTVDPGGPCEASETFNLLVEEVTASFTTNPADLYSCAVPFTIDFISTSSANATGFFYVFQDGESTTLPNVTHEYTNSGVYQPALTVTTDNGCYNTFIGSAITINSPDASFVSNVTEGCSPMTVDFTYSGATPLWNIDNFYWDFDNSEVNPDGGENESSMYMAGDFTVTLTITDNNGCEGVSTLDLTMGEPYVPTIDVTTLYDHLPLTSHVLCTQDSVSLFLQDWDNPDVDEFTWWINSTSSELAEYEYFDYAFDQDTGTVQLHMITLYNGCRDTIYWDSLYISGPIINEISYNSDCSSPLDFTFNLDHTMADSWDWEVFYIIPGGTYGNQIYIDQDFGSTIQVYPITLPNQDHDYWVKVTAYSDTTACQFMDSVLVSISAPQAIFSLVDDESCAGESITFYGGMSLNVTEYYWDFGDGTNSGWISEETIMHTYSTVGWETVTLTVRDANGCEASMADDIHILGAEINISADNTYGCNSLNVSFTGLSLANEELVYELWEFGDGDSGFGGDVEHEYLTPGTYSVTVTIYTISGCVVSQEFPDYITVATINPVFAAPDQIACVGEEMSFNATESDPSYTYTWNFGDGPDVVGSNPTPTHSYSVGGIYDISLEVNNNAGCVEDAMYTSYVVIEDVSASFTVADLPCYPASPDLNSIINVVPEGTILTYYWDMGTGDISEVEDPAFLYTFPGVFTIELTVTTPNGCAATASSDLLIAGPWADVSISNDSVCLGGEIDFEITNLQNVDDNLWSVGGGDSYTETSFTHTYDIVPSMGYYTAELQLTSGECIVFFNTNIYIFDIPEQVTVSGGGNQYGGQAELIATGGENGAIYWQGAMSNGTSTEFESDEETVYDDGTYYFRALSGSSCWGEQGAASVIIADSIEIEITVNDASENNVADGSIAVEITGGTEPYTVTCTSAKSIHNFTELLPGDYTLNVEDDLGNIESKDFVVGVLNLISISEISFGIYPNPAKDIVTLEFENYIPESIKIHDLIGKEVLNGHTNSSSLDLDVSELKTGVYFVEVLIDGKLIVKKLVIE